SAAFAFENDFRIEVPPMDPALIQIDDPVFINNGDFNITTPILFLGGPTAIFSTSSTLDYTNTGTITASPGFDFETFPASFGQAHMANSWVNIGNGFGGGVVSAVNFFGGINILQSGGVDGTGFPINADIAGLSKIRVRATNIVNSGTITTDFTGLIDIVGQ